MARIRSIKPELRTSLTVATWPREARYFWVLLWGYLDDHGYGLDEPRLIKPDCFPLDDDLTVGDIDKWLELFASTVVAPGEMPPLCRYESGGRRYLHAPKWAEHQRPQHPAMPKFPPCTKSHETVMNPSHETHMNGSGNTRETTLPPVYLNGVSAGQGTSGDSHESLTPEQVGVVVVKQVGVAVTREPRSRAASTLTANALLDEHRRHFKPSLPREVAKRVGMQIDSLLDDQDISVDEVREALVRLRSNRKWGPGMLPNLVHEVRQEAAGEGRPQPRGDPRQESTDEMFAAAAARMTGRNPDDPTGNPHADEVRQGSLPAAGNGSLHPRRVA